MPIDIKIEAYLAALDKALAPIPVSERAEIITELKSHIFSAQEKKPHQAIEEILKEIGSPDAVAKRYLDERGIKSSAKVGAGSWLKWLVIGFLGFFGLILLFAGFVIWQFSPLVKVDGANESLKLLGGLITIDGNEENIFVGNRPLKFRQGQKSIWSGSERVNFKTTEEFVFDFSNGKVNFNLSDSEVLTWNCRSAFGQAPNIQQKEKQLLLSTKDLMEVKCNIDVPKKLKIQFAGINGKVKVTAPQFSVRGELTNGEIIFVPRPSQNYDFANTVGNGVIGEFPKSTSGGAKVELKVGNGKIVFDKNTDDGDPDDENL